MKARRTLFSGMFRTVLVGLLIAVVSATTLGYVWVLRPLAERSADDFAALLLLSASSFSELRPSAHGEFMKNLRKQHHLLVTFVARPLDGEVQHHPYLNLLRSALIRRTGLPEQIRVGEGPDLIFHAEIAVEGGWLRFTFDIQRITPRPQQAILAIVLALLVSSGVTAWLIARHISRPVSLLADGALQIGRGGLPLHWPDSRFRELQALSDAFAAMSTQLAAQRESQLTLMAGISHDLRSPLARLRMAVGMLGGSDDSETLRRMEIDIAEMNRLIAAQMDLTRAQQAEVASVVDVGARLREVADGAEAQLPGSVSLRLPQRACEVLVPAMALHRVVANLVDNAQVHGGGRLSIACRNLRGCLCIGVRDRGPGIALHQREAIFRPFHRLDPARQRGTGGSGLGLAIARQLAQTHGWSLGVRHRTGGGSSFWLLIPPTTANTDRRGLAPSTAGSKPNQAAH